MAQLAFHDEGSRLVEAINMVPDTIGRRQAIVRALRPECLGRISGDNERRRTGV
jgi:hypothetical protein